MHAAARWVFVLFATSMFIVPQSLQCWKKQGAGPETCRSVTAFHARAGPPRYVMTRA